MKYALVVGNSQYSDPKLAQLKTPEADSRAFAKVLRSRKIGNFDEVVSLVNQTEAKTRRAISSFLADKKPDDLVLLYFSGHGILDGRGSLFLALKDTQTNSLNATAISSSFISYEMDICRSRQQILILDCCNSGAFARGTKGSQKVITESTFEGSGSGRVVLTASDSYQFAFEGDQIITQTDLSLFTHFLLEGLKTGAADRDGDGMVSLDEWYDYCYARITATTNKQVPHKWSYRQQGDLIIAQNPFGRKKLVLERQPKSIQLRSMLDQKRLEYRKHKLLLDLKEIAIIAAGLERTKLELQEEDKRLILLSAVAYGDGQRWLTVCGKNGLRWLREAYQDGNCPQEARFGAAHFLGEQGDAQTYDCLLDVLGQNAQPTKRGIWLDLLAQYLNGSVHRYRLPISLRKEISLRLIKIGIQESADARRKIGTYSGVIGFLCSLFAIILSLLGQATNGWLAVISTILFSMIGAVLAIVFAQALTLTTHITRKWRFPWQLLVLAGTGSMIGAGLFFCITAYVHVWFMGGIIGITQAVLSRVKSVVPAIVSILLTLAVVIAGTTVALADREYQLAYAFSASLFSAVYFYSVFQVTFRSQIK